jgi:hypothetical protein
MKTETSKSTLSRWLPEKNVFERIYFHIMYNRSTEKELLTRNNKNTKTTIKKLLGET